MSFLLVVGLGAVAGFVASIALKNPVRQSLVLEIVLGILGAILGSVLMTWFSQPGAIGYGFYSALASVITAMILVWLSRIVEIPTETPHGRKKFTY